MILLDTNVISELMKPQPDVAVEGWVARQTKFELFISAITEAELRYGVAILPEGQRRVNLQAALAAMLAEDFEGFILPFDSAAASHFALIASERRKAGRPISQMDAQIAAIARSRNTSLATRNIQDFQNCGIIVIDPWTSQV